MDDREAESLHWYRQWKQELRMKRDDDLRGTQGAPDLSVVEALLDVELSTGFRALWNVCVPELTPPFTLSICERGGELGACRSHPDGYEDHGWILEIEIRAVESGLFEHVLAHEVMHLVLYWAGFPGILVDAEEDDERAEVAHRINSVIQHPIITLRLAAVWDVKASGLMVQRQIDEDLRNVRGWADESAEDEVGRNGHVLSYVLSRLDCGDTVAEALAERWPEVGVQGDEVLEGLREYGFRTPVGEWAADLTPEQALGAGRWLVKRFGIENIAECKMLYERV